MRRIAFFIVIAFLFFNILNASAQRNRGGGLLEYPDGSYGQDLGGGYKSTPDNEVLMPSAYRTPYDYTQFGPMYGGRFPTVQNPPARADEDGKKVSDHVFHESTTVTFDSMLWGVYDAGVDASSRPSEDRTGHAAKDGY